jgi:hypothetical protein
MSISRHKHVQRHPRVRKRLEVSFSSGGTRKKGILSNMSLSGLFIRTSSGFAPGTHLDIELLLSGDVRTFLKGVVVRTVKTPLKGENGMGISLVSQDENYTKFVQQILQQQGIQIDNTSVPEYQIVTCPDCGIKNRVPLEKLLLGTKCGRCRANLMVDIN